MYNTFMPNDNNFGKRLSKIRKQKGYTQTELAEKMELTQILISNYEIGRLRLHAKILLKFAETLNVSIDEIIGHQNENQNDIPSLRLMKRLYQIENLSASQQKVLLKNIDMFIEAAENQNLRND